MVIHLRYEMKYIDGHLRAALANTQPGLGGRQVLLSYLYQSITASTQADDQTQIITWQPRARYPFRFGNIEDAFVEGDVAHFYVEVNHYPTKAQGESVDKELDNRLGKVGVQQLYALLAQKLDDACICTIASTYSSSFQAIVNGIDKSHLCSAGRSGEARPYDPLFVRIGIPKLIGQTRPHPTTAAKVKSFQSHERGFEISRRQDCVVPIEVYQPTWSAVPESNCKLQIQADRNHLSFVEDLPVSSRYDTIEAFLRPILDEQGWFGRLSIASSVPDVDSIAPLIVGATWNCWVTLPPQHRPLLAYCGDAVGSIALLGLGVLTAEYVSHPFNVWYLALGAFMVFLALVFRRAVGGSGGQG